MENSKSITISISDEMLAEITELANQEPKMSVEELIPMMLRNSIEHHSWFNGDGVEVDEEEKNEEPNPWSD